MARISDITCSNPAGTLFCAIYKGLNLINYTLPAFARCDLFINIFSAFFARCFHKSAAENAKSFYSISCRCNDYPSSPEKGSTIAGTGPALAEFPSYRIYMRFDHIRIRSYFPLLSRPFVSTVSRMIDGLFCVGGPVGLRVSSISPATVHVS